MGSSFYLQIAPYLLLEYTYGGQETTFISNQVKLARIKNDYLNGQIQFLNTSPSQHVTQNVLDTSAANLGGYKWAFLDKDVPVPYISQDKKLIYTDLSTLLPSLYVTYDRVRIHILSGYRLEDLQGLIIQIYGKEAQTALTSILANNVYLNSDDRDILNPKPVLMGDKMYDRYIELLVPSIKEINTDYYSNPTNSTSLGWQYTTDNNGFLINTAIYISVYEIERIEKTNGNLFLYTSRQYEININQEDTYSLLRANIQESIEGDYFTYYPTYNGNFIEEFIADMDAQGGSYMIINDIDVNEQVGSEHILTSSFSQIQTGSFDEPLDFRPLLKYADSAVAFSIDYTVRIFNRENGFQLLRRASTTSFNTKKYGKHINKIALAQQSYPMKVYNKIGGSQSVTFTKNETTSSFNTVYVPVFYDTKNIVLQTKSVLSSGTDPVNPNFESGLYFGQGEARLYLSEFDSYIKFTINQIGTNNAINHVNLSSSDIQLAFKDSSGNIMKYPALDSTAENTKTAGELVFKRPHTVRTKVFPTETSTKTTKNFYLISSNPGSSDTIMYTGSVDISDNVDKEALRISTLTSGATLLSSSSTTATSTSTGATSSAIPNKSKNPSLTEQLTQKNATNIGNVTSTPYAQTPTVPGFSNDPNAISIKSGLTPTSNTSTVKKTN